MSSGQSDKRAEASALLEQALKLFGGGDSDSALDKLDEAIALARPKGSVIWATKSRMLYSIGRLDEAVEAAKSAVRIDPKVPFAWAVLGSIYMDREQFREAALALGKATEIDEDFGLYTLLAAAESQFDPEAAVKHAKRALALNPDWQEAEAILRSAEMKLADRDKDG